MEDDLADVGRDDAAREEGQVGEARHDLESARPPSVEGEDALLNLDEEEPDEPTRASDGFSAPNDVDGTLEEVSEPQPQPWKEEDGMGEHEGVEEQGEGKSGD
ncbi:MAG: hypothetical protein AAF715_26505 [Myxococcota bacterium]